jgi:DNA replication protein DnaC
MAKAFQEQCASPDLGTLSFEERIGILADREAAERDTKRMATRLRFASLRHAACVEDIDLRAPRGIDRQLLARLITGDWIDKRQNCLITGPTGVGKSWLACALGHKACRDGRSVSYQRVPRLFEALALARGDGRHAQMLKTFARTNCSSSTIGASPSSPSHNASISWRSSKTETAMAQPSSPARYP